VIQANYSGDDGGGIFVLDALDQPVNIRNNMINENGSADLGGAIMLDDSSKVTIVNNTVANNVSTASSESSDGLRHGAGLSAEANDTLWQSDSRYVAQYPNPATRPDFANPTALFNNIFWQNNAYTLSSTGPGATLVNQGFLDFEIHGTTRNADRFTPRFSDLTNGQILVNGLQFTVPANQGNMSAAPGFVGALPITAELTVSGSRLDPQVAAVSLTAGDPPVGMTSNYHLVNASTVIDRGVRCSLTPFPVPANALTANCAATPPAGGRGIQAPSGIPGDIDGQYRPQRRVAATSPRARTPWDLGADEVPGTIITLSPAAAAAPAGNAMALKLATR
jgi:large repetitive protein